MSVGPRGHESRRKELNLLSPRYQRGASTSSASTGWRRVRDSNSPGCHPVDGLAGRSLTRSANSPKGARVPAYPECDSNARCPRPERGASCRWATRAYRGRRPYIVDNLGIEPSRRCLQDSAAHLCVARESQRGGSFLRVTNPVRHLSRRAGMQAGDRSRTCDPSLTRGTL